MSMPAEPTEPAAVMWSRAALRALVAGRTVYQLRPIDGGQQAGAGIPIPDWLLRGSAGADSTAWSGRLRAVHPHDRAVVAGSWRSAVSHSGEIVEYTVRARVAGELRLFEELMLNLDGRDGLNVVVTSVDRGPVPDLDDWETLESQYGFKSTPVAIEYLDEFGTMLRVEGQVAEIFGQPAADMIGHWALECIHKDHHDTLLALWLSLVAEPGRIQSMRLRVVRPDLSSVWVETTLINRLSDERIGAVVALVHDITDQLASEEAQRIHESAMRRSHEEFEVLANQVPAAMFRADRDGHVTFANLQWHRLTGVEGPLDTAASEGQRREAACPNAWDPEARGVARPLSLYDVVARDERGALQASLSTLFCSEDAGTTSIEVRSRKGDRVFCLACQSVSASSEGFERVIIGSMTDVTSATELRHRSLHDGLTGLLNRSGIDACLAEALDDAHVPVVVAFVDLDGFKAVNDDCGHEAGDRVLQAVAARLRQAVRPSDKVGRYGGDEFVIVCSNASAGTEDTVARRIEAAMSSPIPIPSGTWTPAASAGLARARVGEHATSLMQRADRAMYTAKRAHHRANLGLAVRELVSDEGE